MSRAAIWLLSAGVLLFAGVVLSQGITAVFSTLALAGWGLIVVALWHLVPLVLDAGSIRVLFADTVRGGSLRDSVLARWAGESANSFLPAGPISGPVVMARHLAQRGMPMQEAAASITVSTTLQTLAQVVFGLAGFTLLLGQASGVLRQSVLGPLLIASSVVALCLAGFYLMQRRGLFGKLMRATSRLSARRDWSELLSQAAAIDQTIREVYARRARAIASFALSLIGWVVGTVEVYLILRLLGSPVDWSKALLLESLGQAIRSAGFAVPGSLGVQEGGYLLLAPLAGLQPNTAVALSLAKRAREILLGLPGLLYVHLAERRWRRREACAAAVD
ncbi:MAG TPA: lysylphosphatidylglycerol synthase domain-containing protein [Steroidobacteraceae bacterium]|nr:lysylphosphatidylglycerol synthase domain-containing protein [Steroidobacteraceae bacterium]